MQIPIEIIVISLTSVLGSMGFLIVKVLNAFSKNTDAFNSINESIQDIRLWITKKDTCDIYEEKECEFLHRSINQRFEIIEKRIDKIEKKP